MKYFVKFLFLNKKTYPNAVATSLTTWLAVPPVTQINDSLRKTCCNILNGLKYNKYNAKLINNALIFHASSKSELLTLIFHNQHDCYVNLTFS